MTTKIINGVFAIGLVGVMIWYLFWVVPAQDDERSAYWDAQTKACQERGGILQEDGCLIGW